jgi:hypothetical protein
MEHCGMSLVRIAVMIALSVAATTLQASARPAPSDKSDAPATPQKQPHRGNIPVCKAEKTSDKHKLMLVLAPSTSAWSDPAQRDLSGGPKPAAEPAIVNTAGLFLAPIHSAQTQDLGTFRPRAEAMRCWMAARYPHAPPRH